MSAPSDPPPFKLKTPPRVYPLRSMATAFRRADRGAVPKARRGGPLISSEDVVLEAVKLGYKIADEQILKGQDFARKLRGASLRSEAGELGSLVDQGLRLARHFAVLLVEMTETTVQAPAIAKAFAKAVNEGTEGEGGTTSRPASRASSAQPQGIAHSIPIQVKSEKQTRVSLVLYEALSALPDAYPLYPKNKKDAALTTVNFVKLEGSDGFVLSIDVPGHQAAGCYRGSVISSEGQRTIGSIEVTVLE